MGDRSDWTAEDHAAYAEREAKAEAQEQQWCDALKEAVGAEHVSIAETGGGCQAFQGNLTVGDRKFYVWLTATDEACLPFHPDCSLGIYGDSEADYADGRWTVIDEVEIADLPKVLPILLAHVAATNPTEEYLHPKVWRAMLAPEAV